MSLYYVPRRTEIVTRKKFNSLMRYAEIPCESIQSLPSKIRNLTYYQGFLPRKDAEDMCLQTGDFLVRRARIPTIGETVSEDSYEDLRNISFSSVTPREVGMAAAATVGPDDVFDDVGEPSSPGPWKRTPRQRLSSTRTPPYSPSRADSVSTGSATSSLIGTALKSFRTSYPEKHLGPNRSLSPAISTMYPRVSPLRGPKGEFPKTAEDWGIVLTVRISDEEVKHIGFPKTENNLWLVNKYESCDDLAQYLENCRRNRVYIQKTDDGVVNVPMLRAVPTAHWHFPHSKIVKLHEPFASDEVGRTFKGYIILAPELYLYAAIRCLPSDTLMTKKQVDNFINEANIMRYLQHKNVIKFRGIAILELPLMIIMEWCPNGDLSTYIKEYGHTYDYIQLLVIAIEAASGLAYLANLGIIHRDIRASNFFLDQNYVLKVGNFGLAQKKEAFYARDSFNIPWRAPETLKNYEFTEKSDIWSFGIFLYELYSNGKIPYMNYKGDQLIEAIINGVKPEKPQKNPRFLNELLKLCHQMVPQERPQMNEIEDSLRNTFDNEYPMYMFTERANALPWRRPNLKPTDFI